MDNETDKISIAIAFLFAFLATLILVIASCNMHQNTTHLIKTNNESFNFIITLIVLALIFFIGMLKYFRDYLKIRSEK
jgi:hypothetical protein